MQVHQSKLIILLLALLLLIPSTQAQDDPSPYDIALQRIEESRISGSTELDLSQLSLSEVPSEIGQLSDLQILYLYDNELTQLPSEIGQLNNLQLLHLNDNGLTTIPPEIGQLSNLQMLFLANNDLVTLPPEIGQLSNLLTLNLYHNRLNSLPLEIKNLDELRHLTLSFNELSQLPVELGYLTQLAGTEPICLVPRRACEMPYLLVDNNPLVSPPPEVVEQGTEAILEYLRNRAWYHIQRMILGVAGGVGLLVLLILGFRLKQRGMRKAKVKREIA